MSNAESLDKKAQRVILDKAKEAFKFEGDYADLKGIADLVSREGTLLQLDDIKPYEPNDLRALLDDKKGKEDRYTGGLLGYGLNKFKHIESDLDGIQAGLYVIGGDTNIGKTAFLTNLFLDVIETNPKLYGLFFSLDDDLGTILNRLLAIRADIPLNAIKKPNTALDKARKDSRDSAYDYIRGLANDRVNVYDSTKIQSFEILEHHIKRALVDNKKSGKELIIAIDGLQNLDTGEDEQNIREKNIARANLIKGLVNRYSVPILTTVELRKRAVGQKQDSEPTLNDIMETGKFAYNANYVWLLSLDDRDNLEQVSLRVGKNKLSESKAGRYLRFNRQTAGMTETGELIQTRAEETPKARNKERGIKY